MTILPKKKSSQPKSDRDPSGSVDNFTNRGLPQNQVSFFYSPLHLTQSPLPSSRARKKIYHGGHFVYLSFYLNFDSAIFHYENHFG